MKGCAPPCDLSNLCANVQPEQQLRTTYVMSGNISHHRNSRVPSDIACLVFLSSYCFEQQPYNWQNIAVVCSPHLVRCNTAHASNNLNLPREPKHKQMKPLNRRADVDRFLKNKSHFRSTSVAASNQVYKALHRYLQRRRCNLKSSAAQQSAPYNITACFSPHVHSLDLCNYLCAKPGTFSTPTQPACSTNNDPEPTPGIGLPPFSRPLMAGRSNLKAAPGYVVRTTSASTRKKHTKRLARSLISAHSSIGLAFLSPIYPVPPPGSLLN